MRVKIAEVSEITSGAEATTSVQNWIDAYVESNGLPPGRYQIDKVDVQKEQDGWYAVISNTPRMMET